MATEDPTRAVKALLRVYETNPDRAPTVTADRRLRFLAGITRAKPAEVWPLVGKMLLKQGRGAMELHIALERWYAANIPLQILTEWCQHHMPDGSYLVASLCPVSGETLSNAAREMLVRYGHDQRVGRTLYANLTTGSFAGSITSWHESHLKSVRRWKEDPDTNVRSWAAKMEESFLGEIRRWKEFEEEEDLDLL